ncbi:ADP-ribosylation factor-like protein 9 [Nematolebias whitei]|uniref:ADP-ribosylation factor-like protein 9 n=1 Tax=Nematolebias whitei TaxID=451745 RepID=UPI00189740CF|nr:ADP-ribosylation factor-like protein 9 [Nematolebias whitei]
MFSLKDAGVLGVSAVLAGGVAYAIWNHVAAPRQEKPDTRPRKAGGAGDNAGGEEKQEEERHKAAPVEEAVVAPVEAPKTAAPGPTESERTQVLVLGLDGSGKTSLLRCFSGGVPERDVAPTRGFNAVSFGRDDLRVEFLEIGGGGDLRPYWRRYVSKALLLVFVVDSSDPKRFPEAKEHLHELLTFDPCLPIMLLANKQDLPGSCSIADLFGDLALSEVGDRMLLLIGTHAKPGEAELSSGVQDARDMIAQIVADAK